MEVINDQDPVNCWFRNIQFSFNLICVN